MSARAFLKSVEPEFPSQSKSRVKTVVVVTLALIAVAFVAYRLVKTSNRFPNPTNAIYFPASK